MSAPKYIDVIIHCLRLVSEANAHEHWRERQRRAKQQRELVRLTLRTRPKVAVPCDVTIVRVAPACLDTDNLQGSAKHVRDEVAAWLGIDDRDPRVTWNVVQVRGAPREYGIRIIVRAWSTTTVGARVTRSGTRLHLEAVLTRTQRIALGRALLGGKGDAAADLPVSVTFHDADLRVTVLTTRRSA